MTSIATHYAQPGLWDRVEQALRESGLDPEHLNQSDLARVDQFHVGGLDATNELAALAEIKQGDKVLDLGSGIGGPSRHLAATIGFHVTGLDLTDEYCQVATKLAQATGLDSLVRYDQGDALKTPFEKDAFDVVWTQHASMNIADKAALAREMFRVLKPAGRVAVHDIVAGDGAVKFPVPWASRPELSFLTTEQEMLSVLQQAGFRVLVTKEVTAPGIEALSKVAALGASPGFGLRTLMGPGFPGMLANLIDNLKSGSCRVCEVILAK